MTLLALFLAVAVVHASASGSSSLDAVGSVEVNISSSESSASSSNEGLAPIDTASSTSSTFQLVDNVVCNSTVSSKIYVIYNKNRALFDECVSDAQYQVFPYLGTEPSATQVKGIASSTACTAVLTGVEEANFPQCTISGFPLKAAVETILKIHVDWAYDLEPTPSAERFQAMMAWRKNVNLAKEAGVPYDSESELYQEYEDNLQVALSNTSIRVLSDYTVQYQLASGSWVGGEDDDTVVASSTSSSSDTDDEVGTVSAGDGASQVTDSAASNVAENTTATTGSSAASSAGSHAAVVAVLSVLLSALLVS